jgi:glycosyltransferase involved in cell wall biosynthesis
MNALMRKPLLLIWGVYQDSESYPNTRFRLQFLRNLATFEVREITAPSEMPAWSKRHILVRFAIACSTMAIANLRIFWRLLTLGKRPDVAYIPYPAVPTLALLRLLPARVRPSRVVADAFISIHDTVVNDRKLLSPDSLLSKWLHWMESMAYRQADVLIADTQLNADFIASRFDLDPSRIIALPLSTDETNYQPMPYQPAGDHCTVLFIGTMIPLHGIETILEAAKLLEQEPNVRFRLIGNGQEASKVELAIKQGANNLSWQKDWLSARELAAEITSADVCLGIFDHGDKGQRVCPYKIYAYSTVGRAVISAKTQWLESATHGLDYVPYYGVKAGDPCSLAEAVLQLTKDEALRRRYADDARKFYMDHLCNTISHKQLQALLHH